MKKIVHFFKYLKLSPLINKNNQILFLKFAFINYSKLSKNIQIIFVFMENSIELFIDYTSQPSRFVVLYCEINKIPYKLVNTSVLKGDVRT